MIAEDAKDQGDEHTLAALEDVISLALLPGVCVCTHVAVVCLLCVVVVVVLAYGCRWCRAGLAFLPHNMAAAADVWAVVQLYPAPARFRLYASWASVLDDTRHAELVLEKVPAVVLVLTALHVHRRWPCPPPVVHAHRQRPCMASRRSCGAWPTRTRSSAGGSWHRSLRRYPLSRSTISWSPFKCAEHGVVCAALASPLRARCVLPAGLFKPGQAGC